MDLGVTNTTQLSKATCGHLLTGSTTVFVNDGGLSRVLIDRTALAPEGLITGPGGSYVTCEDLPVSVTGDSIISHTPCPDPPHCTAFTGGSDNVFAGATAPA